MTLDKNNLLNLNINDLIWRFPFAFNFLSFFLNFRSINFTKKVMRYFYYYIIILINSNKNKLEYVNVAL